MPAANGTPDPPKRPAPWRLARNCKNRRMFASPRGLALPVSHVTGGLGSGHRRYPLRRAEYIFAIYPFLIPSLRLIPASRCRDAAL